jgi:hypothetical protein
MDASLRGAQRLLGEWIPRTRVADGPGPTLETLPAPTESPRLVSARSIEGPLAARVVPGAPEIRFGGFLDGTQASRIVTYHEAVPIVFATVAAVIRVRRERRLATYGQRAEVDRSLYIPRGLVPAGLWDAAWAGEYPVIDTGEAGGEAEGDAAINEDDPSGGRHPAALIERALQCVRDRRQRLEHGLAERWCAAEESPLYIDGGLTGSERVARAAMSVGVVKRHRTLYVSADLMPVLAGLEPGSRTTAFRIAPTRRTAVSSWYLRLRDARGRDPTWGLVRIEVSDTPADDITPRADEVSRWVMAEAAPPAPLALPDPRWDTMAYGIRDCEEFLRAIT